MLAAISTRWARSLTGDSRVAVTYDEMWIDVVNGTFLPRSPKFNYYSQDLVRIKQFAEERLAGSLDYWTYAYTPKRGDVIVDIGAGIGVDSIALSKLVGPTGHIHSIEAHPWTFAALKKTRNLNKLTNVSVYNLAIADGPSTFWITNLDNNEENSLTRDATTSPHSIPVAGTGLDDFVLSNRIGKIDLLKMNIEGAEELAIKAMGESIKRTNHVVIACHDFLGNSGGTKKLVIHYLKSNGFRTIERPDDPRSYVRDHVHAVRDA